MNSAKIPVFFRTRPTGEEIKGDNGVAGITRPDKRSCSSFGSMTARSNNAELRL